MHPTHVEYVSFRLVPGIARDSFLTAARASDTALAGYPGYLARHLSEGPDGTWTDCVLWADAASATSAAERVMSDPAIAPFMAAIAPDGLTMRHETLHWQRG